MRALLGFMVVATLVVGCNGKEAAPGTGSGSAAAPATPPPATPPPATPPPATPAPAAGKPFDGGTYTIVPSLPGPEKQENDIDTEMGKTHLTMYAFADPADKNTLQGVESNPANIVAGTEDKVMENAVVGMTGNLKATIDDKKTITVDGTKMVDFSAHFSDEDGQFYLRGRVAVHASTLYQVIAMGRGDKTAPAAEAFVASFHLK